MVSRVTVTMTGLAALALVPAALLAVYIILPAFVDSLPALFILLPAVVALSISKILSAPTSTVWPTHPSCRSWRPAR